MALQLGALRNALMSAGADGGLAEKAAEGLAGYENRLAGVDVRLERIEGKLSLVQALLGIVLAGAASLVLKTFL